ncbi:hypothetical protein BGZ54_009269 [Gamsiella multidivaricata]|nr:hypothetical protein BGZ54_009269 [Gamsiella multidivaricata]
MAGHRQATASSSAHIVQGTIQSQNRGHIQNQSLSQNQSQSQARHQTNAHAPASTHHQQQAQEERDSTSNGHNGTPPGFFMKPLTTTPDYRFNLYVQGLESTTTTRSLFELFKPCTEARRALTQQGLYVTVAHESASIKNLPHKESPSTETKPAIPELDNSDDFPSLPSKPAPKKQQSKKQPTLKVALKISSLKSPLPSSSSSSSMSAIQAESASNQTDSQPLDNPINAAQSEPNPPVESPTEVTWEPDSSKEATLESDHAISMANQEFKSAFILGQAYLDFDSGFIGSHQQFLSDGYNSSGFERRPSFLDNKPYMSVDDIDRYMNMLEMSTVAAVPQTSANTYEVHQPIHPSDVHISNTTLDDFILEDLPRRDSTLHFENLPEGLKYQELFELCAQYGSLVLSSVDIRYINEECYGQGRVTFDSHRDAEVAYLSLVEKNYSVRHGDSGDIYPSEPAIDDHLYDQYYQQHQDFLRQGALAPFETQDDVMSPTFLQGTSTSVSHAFTPLSGHSAERDHFWSTPVPDQPFQFDASMNRGNKAVQDVDVETLSYRHEKLSMMGISPQPISLSPASSSTSSLQQYPEWAEPPTAKPIPPISGQQPLQESAIETPVLSESGNHSHDASPNSPSKLLSYSDIVKVPAKSPAPLPPLPAPDLKRRGNTNKSLDAKEYRLNLFLKNLEPTMNEYRLYEICVNNESVDMAIEGLGKLGIHAEVAIPSATNKLRCKTLSDMLFIQNIPPHIKENKLKDLFRPYTIMACNILRDPKTGKSRGVGFLKVRDTKIAERFIEEYHGRVLGKDWKLPLQVSPARE